MEISNLLSVAILATALATFANSSECPAIQNCDCEDKVTGGFSVRCYGDKEAGPSDITEFTTLLLEKFPSKTELDLQFENFHKPANLTSNIFEGLRVKKLTFVRCRFSRWTDKVGGPAFVGLEESLEELEVEDSLTLRENPESLSKVVAPFSLGHFSWLRKVRFHRNRLYEFGEDWFGRKGRRLEELDLQDNEIHEIDGDTFDSKSNLRVVNLAHNKIKRLPFLYHSRKLEKIILRNNKIDWIHGSFFQGMPHLKEIDISYNPIMHLTEYTMGGVWSQLDILDVSETHLHCDEKVNWMIHRMKGPKVLLGKCDAPADVAGKQLRKVIAQRRIHGE